MSEKKREVNAFGKRNPFTLTTTKNAPRGACFHAERCKIRDGKDAGSSAALPHETVKGVC